MRCFYRTVLLAAVAAASIVLPKDSRADALRSSSIYDDLRGLLEDVIKADVSANLAKKIELEHPSLCFYFRGALTRMQTNDWGGVPGQLREGVFQATADYVLFSAGALSSDTIYSGFADFLIQRDNELKIRERGKRDGYCTTKRWEGEKALVDKCDADETKCLLGRVTRSLLTGHQSRALYEVREFILGKLGDDYPEVVRRLVDGTKLVDAINSLTPTGVKTLTDANCKPTLSTNIDSPCWYLDLAKTLEDLTVDVEVTTAGGVCKTTLVNVRFELADFLRRRRDPAFKDNADAVCTVDFSATLAPCRAGLPVKLTGKSLGMSLSTCITKSSIDPSAGTSLSDIGALKSLSMFIGIDDYEPVITFLQGLGFNVDTVAKLQSAVLKVKQVEAALQSLRQTLTHLDSHPEELFLVDILKLLDLIGCQSSSSATKEVCDARKQVIDVVRKLKKSGAVDAVIRLTDTHDYRELGLIALDILGDRSKSFLKNGNDTQWMTDQQRTFLINLLSFVLDSGVKMDDARLIAKQALRDSIQSLLVDSTSGFPTFSERWQRRPKCNGSFSYEVGCAVAHGVLFPRYSLLPNVAVRWEFSDNWFDRSNDGIRKTVSVDAISMNLPLRNYVGIRLSLLDLAGGFTEIALRRNETKHVDERFLALETVRPRVDVWLGFPRLTRRVAVVAGVAAGFVTRTLTTEMAADGNASETLTYGRASSFDDIQWSLNLGAMIFL